MNCQGYVSHGVSVNCILSVLLDTFSQPKKEMEKINMSYLTTKSCIKALCQTFLH